MQKTTVKKNVQALLALARQLAETPGLSWVDASNAIYAPGGPFARLFPTKTARLAYSKMQESEEIDDLIHSLPEPPVRPGPREDWTKSMIPIRKPAKRRSRPRIGSRTR